MQVPIYVPLLLVLGSIFLVGVDIASIEGAAYSSHRETVAHSDDDLTFIASVQALLEPEEEIHTPGQSSIWVIRDIDRGDRILLHPTSENGSDPEQDSRLTIIRINASDHMDRLRGQAQFIVIPTWQLDALAAGDDVDVLHTAQEPFAAHRIHVELPKPPETTPRQERSISLVWLIRNTTADYAQLSQVLLGNGIEGGHGHQITAVDTAVMARDPWLRGAAALTAIAAIVLALMPRVRGLPEPLPAGRGGTGIDVAQMGARFLRSIRNAYVALAVALAVIGLSLVLAAVLYADMVAASSEALRLGQPSYFRWQATVVSLLALAFVAAVLAASRPALEAHMALRRWRRHEGSPPIEGDLGP